jgi:hypothetical protein
MLRFLSIICLGSGSAQRSYPSPVLAPANSIGTMNIPISRAPRQSSLALGLLSLPAETRCRIYDFLSTGSNFWIGRAGGRVDPRQVIRPDGCEARHQILQTCRSIYQEARWIWYSSTVHTFADQNILRSFMVHDKRGFLRAIQHLHIFDLDQSSPMDWLELLPSLKTLAVYTPIVCVHEGWQSDHQIYQDANKSRFGCQQYEHNAGERDIFRLERNFELSVLFRTFTYVEQVWHLDVWLPLSHVFLHAQEVLMSLQICRVNLDTQSVTRRECSVGLVARTVLELYY